MHARRPFTEVFVFSVALGCGPTGPEPLPPDLLTPLVDAGEVGTPAERPPSLLEDEDRFQWVRSTRSPRTAVAPDPRDQPLLQLCATRGGSGDTALHEVAARLAARQAGGRPVFEDLERVTFALRSRGFPQVWPRLWTVSGRPLDPVDAQARAGRWLDSTSVEGQLRCGVGSVETREGERIVAMIAVDALADLGELPTRARVGEQVELDATLLVPLEDASLIALGPRGRPKRVRSSLSSGRLSATFHPDQPGAWLLQVMGSQASGPRPVLEAWVQVGEAPPTAYRAQTVPGEGSITRGKTPAEQLVHMLNAARAGEGLGPLRRDPRLDRLAEAHGRRMMAARRLAHDVGDGNPRSRMEAAGLGVSLAGENVARAASALRAHRALWASPSHRGNLLHEGYAAVGAAAVTDAHGDTWVCEMFARFH